jgi:hypothetical protein
MPFNVMEFLRPHKQAKAGLLEQLAVRLHKGEAIDPDHILEQLSASGSTEQQLQAEIERLDRVAELRARIVAAAPAQKRLDVIQAEIDKAQAAFEKAATDLRRVRDKHATESSELHATLAQADDAKAALLEPGNLPAGEQARLRQLADDAAAAREALSVAKQDLQHARARMAECEKRHPEAQELARRNRGNSDAQEDAKRWDRAKAARTEQLSTAEAALATAQQQADAAAAAEERCREQLITGGVR